MRKVIRQVQAQDGSVAEIVQHGRNDYSLTITSRNTGHNRWGTRREIEQDAAHFVQTGRLPVSGSRW